MSLSTIQQQNGQQGVYQTPGQTAGVTTPVEGGAPAESAAKILDDESNIIVRQSSDFEKLLEELKLERQTSRQEIFAVQFATNLMRIATEHEGLSAQQKAKLEELAELTLKVGEAESDLQQAQGEFDAESFKLQLLTQQLEAMLETQVKTPDERKKEQDVKRRREEQQVKDIETKEIQEEVEVEDIEEEETGASEEEIEALKAQIAEQQKVVDGKKQTLDEKSAAVRNLNAAIDALDVGGLRLLVAIANDTARQLAAAAAEQPDGKETKEKANAIIAALAEYADKIEEMQDEELQEMVAKIKPDIAFLAQAKFTIDPDELPEYNSLV